MITFEQFQLEVPDDPSRENYDAFVRMCTCFFAEDCESYKEGQQKMLASMDMISQEMEYSDESYNTIFRRHGNPEELYK